MKQYYDSYAENSQIQTTADIDHYPKIEGYNFEEEFNLDKFFDAYFHTGIQAEQSCARKRGHHADAKKEGEDLPHLHQQHGLLWRQRGNLLSRQA
jgi:hypothetical protein